MAVQLLATSYSSITSPTSSPVPALYAVSPPQRRPFTYYLNVYSPPYTPTSTSMPTHLHWHYGRQLPLVYFSRMLVVFGIASRATAASPTRPFHLSSVTPASDTLESTLDTRPPSRLLAPLLLARRSLARPPLRDLRQRSRPLLTQANTRPLDSMPRRSVLAHCVVQQQHAPPHRVNAPSPSPRWRPRSFALP